MISKTIQIIPEGDVAVVERLGKFHKQLDPGFHVVVPVVDRVREKMTQREQVFDIPPQKCITSDNAPISADAVVYWKVVDPKSAVYSVVDLKLAIQNLVLTQLRSEIGKLTLDMTFSARDQINAILLKDLDVATKAWGIQITRVEVRDIIPNAEILHAMEQQMAAERTKRAVIIKSEGAREGAINKAEGQAQARLIDARAAAESVKLRAEAEASRLEQEAKGAAAALEALAVNMKGGMEEAAKFQLMREYLSTQRDLATSDNAKVILMGDGGRGEDMFLGKTLALMNSASGTDL